MSKIKNIDNYRLVSHKVSNLKDIENLPKYFQDSFYNLDQSIKNDLVKFLADNKKTTVYIVKPYKKVISGYFITDHKNKYLAFRGRFNYMQSNQTRYACYKKTGHFEDFFKKEGGQK